MTCPVCGGKTTVIDSRSDVETVARRRKCKVCGYMFHTQEAECKKKDYLYALNEYMKARKERTK